MTIKVIDLGPGLFTVGVADLAVQSQLTNLRVVATEVVTASPPVPVLSGEELTRDDQVRFTYVVAGSLFQDLDAGGIIDWSWNNKGQPEPFTYVPSNAEARQVIGTVYPVPIQIGGPITGTATSRGPNPTSDFSWRAKGPTVDDVTAPDPVFGAVV